MYTEISLTWFQWSVIYHTYFHAFTQELMNQEMQQKLQKCCDDRSSGPETHFTLIYISSVVDKFQVLIMSSFYTYQELILPWQCVDYHGIVILL